MNNRWSSRSELTEWCYLEGRAKAMKQRHLREIANDAERADALCFRAGPLYLDLVKQKMDEPIMHGLLKLAEAAGMNQAIQDMMSGQPLNNTEGRSALHTALRLPANTTLMVDGVNVVPLVHQSLRRMRQIVSRIHSRQWRGMSGRPISDVVNIGVGGSDLGPLMAAHALDEFTSPAASALHLHFVSSIDGSQLSALLPKLNPETTLFIISSKSFTTLDTLSNANTALHWMMRRGTQEQVLAHHFIGISARPALMSEWGIPSNNQIEFWDWVGGRFSMWSAIGLPIALQIGMRQFETMLAGAHFMDQHFLHAPLATNLPVLLGLTGVWNASFMDTRAHSVLPYDGRLKFLPSYLSQLEMESNGKSVDKSGHAIDYATCPVLWGEIGPNAQHAFYQLLHQGTQSVSCDFIAPIRRYQSGVHRDENHELKTQHQLGLANCLAQSRVLMLGDAVIDVDENTPGFKRYRGNQPSTTLLLDELDPFTLGALLALYEHKVFAMSVIWDINPFDQWGVELGKKIADGMLGALQGDNALELDASTQRLLDEIGQAQPVKEADHEHLCTR
ncbi:MAG: glucose-6-phosphate isomerase [Pseudomonadota bacterium]|jgi:glucose-6-phosphate isomerase